MARVLITGGAGFIGSHMAERFLSENHTVCVMDNLSSGSRDNLIEGCSFVECDIRSPDAQAAVKDFKPEVLVHAAAQISVSESMKDPLFDASVNICGLVNLLQADPGRTEKPYVAFISTGGAIYGEQDVFPAPETHTIHPESFYGLAKYVGEQYLELWSKAFGLRYGVLRLSNVYGPRQNPHGEAGVVAIFCTRLLAGEQPRIFGDGEQTRDYIYVGDVVSAAVAMVQRQQVGVFNIGTGTETSVNELLRGLKTALESDIEAAYAPGRPGEQRRSVINAGLAKSTFDWEPAVSLQEGLTRTSQWFRERSDRQKKSGRE